MTRRPNLQLLSMEDALAAADRILKNPERNCVRVSMQEVVSLAVLARQLHDVAEVAAALCRRSSTASSELAAAREGALAGLLLQAGILKPEEIKGPSHG